MKLNARFHSLAGQHLPLTWRYNEAIGPKRQVMAGNSPQSVRMIRSRLPTKPRQLGRQNRRQTMENIVRAWERRRVMRNQGPLIDKIDKRSEPGTPMRGGEGEERQAGGCASLTLQGEPPGGRPQLARSAIFISPASLTAVLFILNYC